MSINSVYLGDNLDLTYLYHRALNFKINRDYIPIHLKNKEILDLTQSDKEIIRTRYCLITM